MDDANLDAWQAFAKIAKRIVADLHIGNRVFEAVVAEKSPEQVLDLVERFDRIYSILHPVKD